MYETAQMKIRKIRKHGTSGETQTSIDRTGNQEVLFVRKRGRKRVLGTVHKGLVCSREFGLIVKVKKNKCSRT